MSKDKTKKLVSKEKLQLAEYAGPSRYRATGFLNLEGDSAYVSDGKKMIVITSKDPSAEDYPEIAVGTEPIPETCFLEPKAVAKVLKNFPAGKRSSFIIHRYALLTHEADGQLALSTTDLENSVTIRQQPVDENFSKLDWTKFFPEAAEPLGRIYVDLHNLKALVDAMLKCTQHLFRREVVTELAFIHTKDIPWFGSGEELIPYFRIKAGDGNVLRALLMPMDPPDED